MVTMIAGGATPVVAQPSPAAAKPGVGAPVAPINTAQATRPVAYGVAEQPRVQDTRKDRRRGRHDDAPQAAAKDQNSLAEAEVGAQRGQNIDTVA